MLRHFFALLLLIDAGSAWADTIGNTTGDICDVRPDLCDSGHKTEPARRTRPTTANARGLPQNASPAAARPAPPRPRCRSAAADYRNEDADLPVCHADALQNFSSSSSMRPLANPSARTVVIHSPQTASRAPAAASTSAGVSPATLAASANVTFDEYLNTNAANPAINKKIQDHQRAFVDTAKAAVITMPGELAAPGPDNGAIPLPAAALIPANGAGTSAPTNGWPANNTGSFGNSSSGSSSTSSPPGPTR